MKKQEKRQQRKWKRSRIKKDLAINAIKSFEGTTTSAARIFETYKMANPSPTSLSKSTFYRFMKDELKAKHVKGQLRNKRVTYDSTISKVVEFHLQSQRYLLNNFRFVFIDESSFSLKDLKGKIWKLPDSPGQFLTPAATATTSLILAISNEGTELYHLNSFTTNGEGFTEFFTELVNLMEKGNSIKQKNLKTGFS